MRASTLSDELPLCAESAMRQSGRQRETTVGAAKILGAFMLFTLVCIGSPLLGRHGNKKPFSSATHIEANLNELTGLAEETKAKKSESATEEAPDFHAGWPCEVDEELFFGKCYISCAVATGGNFTERDNECTCCKAGSDHPCNYNDDTAYMTNCFLLNRAVDLNETHAPYLTDCPHEDEELFMGLCYKKCSVMTNGKYVTRTGMNTCSNDVYGGNWTMGFGPCSGFGIGGGEKCLPHIPTPTGTGHEAAPGDQKGVAPMGFKSLPLPVYARNPPGQAPTVNTNANADLKPINDVLTATSK